MTSETIGTAGTGAPARQKFDTDFIGDGFAWLERTIRPNEGWVAAGLLALNLVVVVMSVEQADWVPSPNLVALLFMAMLTGLVLYRIPIWSIALLPVGLAVGLAIILWQLSNFTINDVTINGTGEVIERLDLWLDAARTGSISIDSLPFSFALMVSTWLTGFLGAWLFLRYGNFWGVFVLGGIGLLSNLTFLPPNTVFHLGFYLFTALLLISRVQAIRRKHEWERRSVKVDDHLTGLSLTDSLALTILVIVVAFLLPMAPKWGTANDAYESMRSPLETMEDDFNRLFAGLPARRPIGFRIWDNVMALQGPKHPDLGIAMDMSIAMTVPSGALCSLSLSFNNDGPLGTFFRYICDNGTYIARYDDLVDGAENPIDVSKVDVSMDGIELQDREFFAAIDEQREPNASVAQCLDAMKTLDRLEQTLN